MPPHHAAGMPTARLCGPHSRAATASMASPGMQQHASWQWAWHDEVSVGPAGMSPKGAEPPSCMSPLHSLVSSGRPDTAVEHHQEVLMEGRLSYRRGQQVQMSRHTESWGGSGGGVGTGPAASLLTSPSMQEPPKHHQRSPEQQGGDIWSLPPLHSPARPSLCKATAQATDSPGASPSHWQLQDLGGEFSHQPSRTHIPFEALPQQLRLTHTVRAGQGLHLPSGHPAVSPEISVRHGGSTLLQSPGETMELTMQQGHMAGHGHGQGFQGDSLEGLLHPSVSNRRSRRPHQTSSAGALLLAGAQMRSLGEEDEGDDGEHMGWGGLVQGTSVWDPEGTQGRAGFKAAGSGPDGSSSIFSPGTLQPGRRRPGLWAEGSGGQPSPVPSGLSLASPLDPGPRRQEGTQGGLAWDFNGMRRPAGPQGLGRDPFLSSSNRPQGDGLGSNPRAGQHRPTRPVGYEAFAQGAPAGPVAGGEGGGRPVKRVRFAVEAGQG